MQFTKLRLSGFKSFVDPTDFTIEPGLTGVVGPNGCGKSNLVEALRWVMGENSAKKMRGGAMDDVIFAGTNQRPSRNIAEVSLLLDNRERRAPATFNDQVELEVVRRIEREHGSDYRINGREVRWRDVQLLFADLATGSHSTAMVSQGRVGALINAKPTDRRGLLEEAAGITGLHSRRHEAELRLKAAETNMARLDDLMGQLDQQLQGLKRQARQASRYRSLSGHIRRAEAITFHLRYVAAADALDTARRNLGDTERAVADATTEAARAASHQAGAATAVPPFRQQEAEVAAKLHRLSVAREGLDEEARRAEAQQAQLDARLAQIAADTDREKGVMQDAADSIGRLAEEAQTLESAQQSEAAIQADLDTNADTAEKEVQENQEIVQKLTEAAAADAAKRQQLAEQIANLRQRLDRLNERKQQIDAERAKLLAESDEIAAADAAAKLVEHQQAALDEARAKLDSSEQERTKAQSNEATAREVWQDLQSQVGRLSAEEKGLAKLLAIGDSDLWPPLVDSLAVTPGYETALGAALGDDLSVAADTAAPVHWRGLPAYETPAALPAGVTPLSDYVKAPPLLSRRLSQIGVVDEAVGSDLQATLAQGQRLVSRAGGLWRWDGLTVKAGAPVAAALRLEQRNRLEELRRQVAALEQRLSDARQTFDTARDQGIRAQNAESEARAELRKIDTALNEARQRHASALQKSAARASRLAALTSSMEQVGLDISESDAAQQGAQQQFAQLPPDGEAREKVVAARHILDSLRQELDIARSKRDQAKRDALARTQRLEAIGRETDSWTNRKNGAEEQITALSVRRGEVETEIAAIANLPNEIAQKRNALSEHIAAAEIERQQAADALARAEEALATCDKIARTAQDALGSAREIWVRAESEVKHQEEGLTALAERLREVLDCAPEDALAAGEVSAEEELPTLDAIEIKLDRLKKERDGMGPVNLRADIEAQEIEQQLEGMRSERTDLEAAIAKLRLGISNLNREGRERLLTAFAQVDAHFQQLFVKVFGGGRAHLTLTESEDPLEAGLEIMAQPPGKKLQVLSLLSGGEQALTALSLLFAVFQTNPAPICVLDEVDAPLDDANVERLCDLLDDIAKGGTTRFLVVTHHPITMARMDRLFGVTMAERGVSQLVSVDLQAAEALQKSA